MDGAHRIAGILLLACAVCTKVLGQAPGEKQADISVVGVHRIPLVRINLVIRNTTNAQVFIPRCEEIPGIPFLCVLAVHLERDTTRGWHAAEDTSRSSVPGGMPIEEAEAIDAGGARVFMFQFVSDLFVIPRGARLRLVADAWRNRESIRTGWPGPSLSA